MRFLFRSVLLRSKIERERWAGIDNDYTNVFRVTGDIFIRGSIRNIVKRLSKMVVIVFMKFWMENRAIIQKRWAVCYSLDLLSNLF